MNKLNIPKTNATSKFDEVAFVEDMTPFQLKTLIKNMWENMGELANAMDNNGRDDVSDAIDKMRDGSTWTPNKFRNRFRYALHGSTIMMYDSKTDTFKLLDADGNNVEYQAVEHKEILKNVKSIAKGK